MSRNALNKIFETLHSNALKGVKNGVSYPEVVKFLLLTHKGGIGRFSDATIFSTHWIPEISTVFRTASATCTAGLRMATAKSVLRLSQVSKEVTSVILRILNADWKKKSWRRLGAHA